MVTKTVTLSRERRGRRSGSRPSQKETRRKDGRTSTRGKLRQTRSGSSISLLERLVVFLKRSERKMQLCKVERRIERPCEQNARSSKQRQEKCPRTEGWAGT